ncbi:chloramphenicol acetyltransferase [Solitalea canadensis]|uniref:Chloramphenicol O-acetyltransferase n=1 Tax=Solitalea canadensis (strain ATCC 29591 / DSM 3403 / JCM 21819 / LMG 8368 / NBRC 15130 / NCIMB 12057 / USAM 9D) TaxID=929556 RepID=H8KL75_SOLCM|nr:chloramphenicol acetyltransferase [Solitalea canadensis]AFD09158.1 chloramphenicol O-acetyltransferase [Solitalea canadensis DSM 3403]
MRKLLVINNWARKEHFNLFKKFEEPFFGVCIDIDCTYAYRNAKEDGVSFFLYYLHKSIVAANEIESFRYRIVGDDVFIYDEIHASSTVNRPDGTFGFSYIQYKRQFDEFLAVATEEVDKVRNSKELIPSAAHNNIIHYSSLPWLRFTSLSHARSFSINDSIPKVSFGKMTEENGKRIMPVSIHVHHALMDGYDVGLYVDRFQQLMNEGF